MTHSNRRGTLTVFMIAMALAATVALAARQTIKQGAAIVETFTIEAIDSTTRAVTLRDSEGNLETIICGPEVQRFNALKVGDKVSFRYYESMVYQIQKSATQSGPVPGIAATAGVSRAPGDRPGGTIAQQLTATVTVNAIDVKIPSVTVTSADNRKMSFKVADAKNLEGLMVGDRVDITYTQALAIDVTPPDK
jgi:Cu/Ag efflux protein CusF